MLSKIKSNATIAQGEFQKWQLVIIYLASFIVLTVLFDAVIAVKKNESLI